MKFLAGMLAIAVAICLPAAANPGNLQWGKPMTKKCILFPPICFESGVKRVR